MLPILGKVKREGSSLILELFNFLRGLPNDLTVQDDFDGSEISMSPLAEGNFYKDPDPGASKDK